MSKHGVPVSLKHPLIRENRVRFFLDPKTWFSHLAEYDFSFGTRIHGNIAALLAGTPAVLLAHDSRTLELADYHQIPHRVINSLPDKPDAAALYAEADWSKLNDGHAARWAEFSGFLHQHDLTHVYDEGQNASRFDDKLAATEFAPPVETLMGLPPEDLYAMKRTTDELRDELRKAAEERKALSCLDVQHATLAGTADQAKAATHPEALTGFGGKLCVAPPGLPSSRLVG